jgi:hypothetical protein
VEIKKKTLKIFHVFSLAKFPFEHYIFVLLEDGQRPKHVVLVIIKTKKYNCCKEGHFHTPIFIVADVPS